MLRVLIYSHEYPPFRGGAGIYSYDLANGLAKLGVNVHVLTMRPSNSAGETSAANPSDKVRIHYLESWQTRPRAAQCRLLRLHLRYRFHAVVISERAAQEIAAQIEPLFFRYAAVLHGTEILNYFGKLPMNRVVEPARMLDYHKNALVNIAVSKATRELAAGLVGIDTWSLIAVQNGIDINRLLAVDSNRVLLLRERYPDNAEFVFCLGRLDLDKGHDVLLPAFKLVREQRPQARLLIGGDGPYRRQLEELCRSLGLSDSVEFLGNISDADLPVYYGICDLFVLPSRSRSRWEGFGLVFLEANYYGKPVVGGGEGGVREAIADGESGLVVNPDSVPDVAAAIVRLLQDEQLRESLGRQGNRRVLEYFNSARMANETLRALKEGIHRDTFGRRIKRLVGVFAGFMACQTLRR